MNSKEIAFVLNRMTIELSSPFASTRKAAEARAITGLENAGVLDQSKINALIEAAAKLHEIAALVVSHA